MGNTPVIYHNYIHVYKSYILLFKDEEDMGNTPAHISYNASSDLIKEAALAGEDQVRTCIIL